MARVGVLHANERHYGVLAHDDATHDIEEFLRKGIAPANVAQRRDDHPKQDEQSNEADERYEAIRTRPPRRALIDKKCDPTNCENTQENERESDRVAYAPYILDARVELLLLGFFHEYLRLPSRAICSSDYNGRDGLHQESVSIF